MGNTNLSNLRKHLLAGQVIPAFPLALNADGSWSERHQQALARYYYDAGAGGLAVAVHSTQFEIRDPDVGLFEPVLELAAKTIEAERSRNPREFTMIAGVCGGTNQAIKEAELAVGLGYEAALVSPGGWGAKSEADFLNHCAAVAEVIPIFGFYLQTAVGGRAFSYNFWRQLAEIPNLAGVKMAPFNRYQTIDVVRAVEDAGRDDVALYTGNDDNIIMDLVTPYNFGGKGYRHIVGGLLGQWGVWTNQAVSMLEEIKAERKQTDSGLDRKWLEWNVALTDANAVIFDAANGFAGCIPGIMEVLRRQGLVPSTRCLNEKETLSPGQAEELDRIAQSYPFLNDDEFVQENLSRWLEQITV